MHLKVKQHPAHKDIFVTDDGRVFRELTPSPDDGGYNQIRNGKFRTRRHVLVAETYHGPQPFPGAVVRHLNTDPTDDTPGNLAWGTQQENIDDTVDAGKNTKGAAHPMAKLTEAQAQDILNRRSSGESGRALALEFGIKEAAVCDLYKGRTWGHLTTCK